jgi:hypothetical protein
MEAGLPEFLKRAVDGVNGQLQTLAACPFGKRTQISVRLEAPDWRLWRRKNLLSLTGIETRYPDCPVCSLVTILTELSLPLTYGKLIRSYEKITIRYYHEILHCKKTT